MKTSRRSFLGMLGAGAAAVVAKKLPKPAVEPEEDTIVTTVWEPEHEPCPFPHDERGCGGFMVIETQIGTLRFNDDLLAFPDNEPEGWFQFTNREEWTPVKVIDGCVEKEILSLHGLNSTEPLREMVTRISGEITMRKQNGREFTARIG